MRYTDDGTPLHGPELPTDSNEYPDLGPGSSDPWPGYNEALAQWGDIRWDRRNKRWEPR